MKTSLLAVAALALTGAAPLPDLTAAATCTLRQADTEKAFRALPLASTEDDSEADESGTIYGFTPAGVTVQDGAASRVQLTVYANRTTGDVTQRYDVTFPGDYADVRTTLATVNATQPCARDIGSPGSRSCQLVLNPDGKWRKSVSIAEEGGALVLSCTFSKDG